LLIFQLKGSKILGTENPNLCEPMESKENYFGGYIYPNMLTKTEKISQTSFKAFSF
jgi:hypothetical protein